MKWIDYREKLGIGFNDDRKHQMLSNVLRNYVENVVKHDFDSNSYLQYCQMVGETYYTFGKPFEHLSENLKHCKTIWDLVSHYVAFCNTYEPVDRSYYYDATITVQDVIKNLKESLDNLNLNYEILEDNDGIFVFPKGAKELDDALVSEPLEWLKDYPKAHKTYINALKQYSEGIYIRDVADNLRKALEEFLQEFLSNDKNLESNKNEICKYLGQAGVDAGITGLFQPLINSYKNINDRIAKHNDKVDEKLLEFLLYQTGVLIRMVITVKMEENNAN